MVKRNSDRKARIALKKSQDAASSCCEYEMERVRYARRANHLAMAAANDITGRTTELVRCTLFFSFKHTYTHTKQVEFLTRFFDHAATLMRRVGPELRRVRELTMKAAVHSVNDDGCGSIVSMHQEHFEKHGKEGGLPKWNNRDIYELPRRDHFNKMFLDRLQDSIQMGWLLKVASASFPGRSRWRRRWFWIDMKLGKLRYLKNSTRVPIDLCDLTITTDRRFLTKPHSFEMICTTFKGGEPYVSKISL